LATERVERRLTAILAADVAGYSRLTGNDEEGTHAQLQDHLRSLVDPKIAEHRGRVVKNTGDGMLAEFGSVVDAVRCAVDIQRGMAERNADVPGEKLIEFRIGINMGDIIIDRGDIFGDGVNVAARLEGSPSRAASACRVGCRRMRRVSWMSVSRMRASSSSRTSPDQCASIMSGSLEAPRREPSPKDLRYPISHPSPSYHSRI
jgi:class 3 adenylate cyclase